MSAESVAAVRARVRARIEATRPKPVPKKAKKVEPVVYVTDNE